jgi:hypothetical protein
MELDMMGRYIPASVLSGLKIMFWGIFVQDLTMKRFINFVQEQASHMMSVLPAVSAGLLHFAAGRVFHALNCSVPGRGSLSICIVHIH